MWHYGHITLVLFLMEYEILYEEIFILAMVAKPIAKVHSKPQNKTKQTDQSGRLEVIQWD